MRKIEEILNMPLEQLEAMSDERLKALLEPLIPAARKSVMNAQKANDIADKIKALISLYANQQQPDNNNTSGDRSS